MMNGLKNIIFKLLPKPYLVQMLLHVFHILRNF